MQGRVLALHNLNCLSYYFQYVGVHRAMCSFHGTVPYCTVLILTYEDIELCDSENTFALISNAVILSFGTGVSVLRDFPCAECPMSDLSPLRCVNNSCSCSSGSS